MKKTLLALSVLAAGSAQAGINLYNANGVTVDLSGAAEVQYMKDYDEKKDAGLHLDDGDLSIDTTVAINDQLNAVAGISFDFEKTEMTNDKLFVGLGGDFGTVTFGRQLYISDDAGNGKDVELGANLFGLDDTDGNEVIKYVYDNGTVYFGISHDLDADNANGGSSDYLNNDGTMTDARLGARFEGLDVRVYYYTSEVAKVDTDGFNLEADYAMGQFEFSANYGQVEVDNVNTDFIGVAGAYTMGKNTFALGYGYKDHEKDGDSSNVYANVSHQLHSNVKVYAEMGWIDTDNSDLGYLAGMEVAF